MRRHAAAEVLIAAPIDLVWSVMLDTDAYPDWNPFVVRISGVVGAPAVGQVLRLAVRWGDGSRVRTTEVIRRLEPPAPTGAGPRGALLAYEFLGPLRTLHLVRGTRLQRLEERPGGATRYHTEEQFRGLLAAFVPLRRVEDGFQRHARALKARAESLAAR